MHTSKRKQKHGAKPSLIPRTRGIETERAFQARVVELARLLGWRVYHSRPAQYRDGRWTTPLTGDPGLPDLILCKPPRLIFAELKRETRKPTQAQQEWLHALALCKGVEVYLWKPSDWKQIVETLRHEPAKPTHTEDIRG